MFRYVSLHFDTFRYVSFHYVAFCCVSLRYVSLRYVSLCYVSSQKCAIATFISLVIIIMSSADFLSMHYMKVYSNFFLFFSINRKKVFLYRGGPMKRTCCNML